MAHTAATFLESYEVPSLSDWAIHRGGTIFLEGARDCVIEACFFDAVGGNAVFMNNYNRNNLVTGCKFTETGDSAICFRRFTRNHGREPAQLSLRVPINQQLDI